ILSSNAYNSQPWLFRLSTTRIDLRADLRRNLGAFDPYLRELHFSLGCALENLLLAGAAEGYDCALTTTPGALARIPEKPQPELAAHVELAGRAPTPSELHDAIPHRHTNRNPFDSTRPLALDVIEALGKLAADEPAVSLRLVTDDSMRRALIDLIVKA